MVDEDLKKALILAAAPFLLGGMFLLLAYLPAIFAGAPMGAIGSSSYEFAKIGGCACSLGPVGIIAAVLFLILKLVMKGYSRKPKRARKKGS